MENKQNLSLFVKSNKTYLRLTMIKFNLQVGLRPQESCKSFIF